MFDVQNIALLDELDCACTHTYTLSLTHTYTHNSRQKAKMVQTQELLLCAPVSSSCFRRFFALISFMASSMERVSLLLATGTVRGNIPT